MATVLKPVRKGDGGKAKWDAQGWLAKRTKEGDRIASPDNLAHIPAKRVLSLLNSENGYPPQGDRKAS